MSTDETASKNENMREAFYAYCKAHPEYRFFQALRNWVREEIDPDINFVLFGDTGYAMKVMDEDYEGAIASVRDTFYIEDDLGQTRN